MFTPAIKVGDIIINSIKGFANSVVTVITGTQTNGQNIATITTALFSVAKPQGAYTLEFTNNQGISTWVFGQ